MKLTSTQEKALENGRVEYDDEGNVVRFTPIGARSDTVRALLNKGYISIVKTIGHFSSQSKGYNFGRTRTCSTVWVEEPVYTLTPDGMSLRHLI